MDKKEVINRIEKIFDENYQITIKKFKNDLDNLMKNHYKKENKKNEKFRNKLLKIEVSKLEVEKEKKDILQEILQNIKKRGEK